MTLKTNNVIGIINFSNYNQQFKKYPKLFGPIYGYYTVC